MFVPGLVLSTSLLIQPLGDVQKLEEKAYAHLLDNISPAGTEKGTVVAGTSKYRPNYWYHWTRDAALVMDVLLQSYQCGDQQVKKNLFPLFVDYVSLSKLHQATDNLSGGFGEPKFHVDGSAFNEPWGRPQNDGPALRALTLTRLSQQLIKEEKLDLAAVFYASIIQKDLDFVVEHWREPNFDLWEEVKGDHFYTKMVQRQALHQGAQLADSLGKKEAADIYRQEALLVEASIRDHFTPDGGILPTLNPIEGITWKTSPLDSCVILAVLHTLDDSFLSPTDDKVLRYAHEVKRCFSDLYPINSDGKPGVAIGRYPEDRYNGVDEDEAHPWFLLTFAFGEYCLTVANYLEKAGEIVVTEQNLPFFEPFVTAPTVIKREDLLFQQVIQQIRQEGVAFIQRGLAYTGEEMRLAEQFDRRTGAQRGAENLTWSYANLLRALWALSPSQVVSEERRSSLVNNI